MSHMYLMYYNRLNIIPFLLAQMESLQLSSHVSKISSLPVNPLSVTKIYMQLKNIYIYISMKYTSSLFWNLVLQFNSLLQPTDVVYLSQVPKFSYFGETVPLNDLKMNHGKVVLKNSDFKTFSWGKRGHAYVTRYSLHPHSHGTCHLCCSLLNFLLSDCPRKVPHWVIISQMWHYCWSIQIQFSTGLCKIL